MRAHSGARSPGRAAVVITKYSIMLLFLPLAVFRIDTEFKWRIPSWAVQVLSGGYQCTDCRRSCAAGRARLHSVPLQENVGWFLLIAAIAADCCAERRHCHVPEVGA